MELMPLLALAALLLIFGFLIRGKGSAGFLKGIESSRNASIDSGEPDFNARFLAAAGPDREAVHLVEVFNPVDQMIIRSLLDAQGILTYIEPSSLETLFPGVRPPGRDGTVIQVYDDESNEAQETVADFILDLRQRRTARIHEKLKNLGDNAVHGYRIPPHQDRMMPRLLIDPGKSKRTHT
ncbi:MAG: hypothetical protein JXB03_01900 [Spirochaetales bacterium]|nr:hypothetical protein [Spirochaetales bacterium]